MSTNQFNGPVPSNTGAAAFLQGLCDHVNLDTLTKNQYQPSETKLYYTCNTCGLIIPMSRSADPETPVHQGQNSLGGMNPVPFQGNAQKWCDHNNPQTLRPMHSQIKDGKLRYICQNCGKVVIRDGQDFSVPDNSKVNRSANFFGQQRLINRN